jgi:hypothetical protein
LATAQAGELDELLKNLGEDVTDDDEAPAEAA